MRSPGTVAVFLTVLTLAVLGSHRYLHSRTVVRLALPPRLAVWGRRFWIASAIGLVGGMVVFRLLPPRPGVLLAIGVFCWLGLLGILLPATAVGEAIPLLARLWEHLRARMARRWRFDVSGGATRDDQVDPSRRAALARFTAAATGAGALSVAADGVRTALAGPEVVRLTVRLPRLPPAFEGLRVVQLSDVHVGPLIGRDYTDAVAAQVRALRPDVLVITGDLVDGSVAQLAEDVSPLLSLPATHGTFFCTGNHEYYSGADAWCEHLASRGVVVLRNQRHTLERNGQHLEIVGVDDWGARAPESGFDLDAACRDLPPDRCALLLCHQPKGIDAAAAAGLDLVLSGHTHGGQIWPYGYLVALVQPYVQGLHTHTDRTQIYVHRGTGFWGPPLRVRVRAEIALLTLTSGRPAA